MNIEELKEAIEELIPGASIVVSGKNKQIVIHTGMTEDEDGELTSLDDVDEDFDFDGEHESLDALDPDEDD